MLKLPTTKREIRNNLAQILGISRKDFNLKGKSKEKLGEVGRGKAIECYAVSMVRYKG